MARVTGIGGVFFRAADPAAFSDCYRRHLGIDPVDVSAPWQQLAGPTVFQPFPLDTDHSGEATQPFMLNFRVADLDALTAELRTADVPVETRAE